jgi:hypothetical protein
MKKSTPQISLNKLAEFVNASSARKRSILKTIKSNTAESRSKRQRYATAKSAINSFMVDKKHALKIFEEKKKYLLDKKTESPQQANDIKNSLAAIKILEQLAQSDLTQYQKFYSQRPNKEQKNTRINGVLVHLAPDIVFLTRGEIKGAMKLIFSKRPITPLEGQIIAGLTAKFLEKNFKARIYHKDCFALDVFAKRIHPVPESFKYYSIVLKKAYAEINKLWTTIK